MSAKELVLEAMNELPGNCSLDEIVERIELLAAIQRGVEQLDRDEGIPHEEVKKQMASWVSK